MIEINHNLSIPEREVSLRTSTSSGPGGQNVNKLETRVTLLFDIAASETLSDEQKERIAEVLSTRVNREGVLRVTSQKHRTQAANRKAAEVKFADLLGQALERDTPRKKTRPSRAAKRRRLKNKRQRSEVKKLRKPPKPERY